MSGFCNDGDETSGFIDNFHSENILMHGFSIYPHMHIERAFIL
jgi:hypothetical protein